MRDGYAGYEHLADALHARCGAHNLRDLYTFDPDGQVWARSMADLLIHANAAATTSARTAGRRHLDEGTLAEIRTWYRAAVAKGITGSQAEPDIRPVEVQQRTSGGCWRPLAGLAGFAAVQSYLSTAAKCGISKLDALRQLFTTGPGGRSIPSAARRRTRQTGCRGCQCRTGRRSASGARTAGRGWGRGPSVPPGARGRA